VRIARALVELPERVDFSRSDANDWMATSGTIATWRDWNRMSASEVILLQNSR
jgi:hypothetical protein